MTHNKNNEVETKKFQIDLVGNKLWILAKEPLEKLSDTLTIKGIKSPLTIRWHDNKNDFLKELVSGFNLIKNGTFGNEKEKSILGWDINVKEPANAQVDLSEKWHLKDGHTAFLFAPTEAERPSFSATHKILAIGDGSVDYRFSGFFALHRAGGSINIDFYDKLDVKLGEQIINIPFDPKYTGGQSLTSYTRIESIFTPIKGSQYMRFKIELGGQEEFSEPHACLFFTRLCLRQNNEADWGEIIPCMERIDRLTENLFGDTWSEFGHVNLPILDEMKLISIKYLKHTYEISLKEIEHFILKKAWNNLDFKYGIDNCFFITKNIVFISGWLGKKGELAVISDLCDVKINFFSRPDIKAITDDDHWKAAGFFGFLFFDNKLKKNQVQFELSTKNNIFYFKHKIDGKKDVKKSSQDILSFINIKKGFKNVFDDILGDGIKAMWEEHCDGTTINPVVTLYGEIPKEPNISIIVPLYGRIDFMEYQTSIFALDKSFRDNIELIYVLDDPDRFYDLIDPISKDLYQLNKIPFKVIKYDDNLGYARANNLGVQYATSDMILLLNSDVFPQEPLWTDRLLQIYKTLENPGVLGCKLLFEDGSIQHAGMKFKKNEGLDNMWTNVHPYKGLPNIDKSPLVKEVPAVTGACMLLEKENYLAVEGLDESYILGDFEDSDLCLKLIDKDFKVYYSSEPELYHLERQSQSLFDDQTWKFKITIFNCWQHSLKWDKKIEVLMESNHE